MIESTCERCGQHFVGTEDPSTVHDCSSLRPRFEVGDWVRLKGKGPDKAPFQIHENDPTWRWMQPHFEPAPPPASERSGRVVCGWHGTDMCGPGDGSRRNLYRTPSGDYICGQYAGYTGATVAFESTYRDKTGFIPDHAEFERLRAAGKVERYYDCECRAADFDPSQWCACTPGPRGATAL